MFLAVLTFHACPFYEKWKELPSQLGKIFLVRQLLPGIFSARKNPPSHIFLPDGKSMVDRI